MARIGTAAWAIPKAAADAFPADGSVLERYAAVFDAVEINSSFYRRHRAATYARWAASVPTDFRFSVKAPKAVSHEARLQDCDAAIGDFLDDVAHLGPMLGPILLQLPPSLAFDAGLMEPVCRRLGDGGRLALVCEPRHASWFTPDVDAWLAARRIARVAADPARHAGAERPGGWRGLSYYRLHGSPRMYYSPYAADALAALEAEVARDAARDLWCIFDNTALGAATMDAMSLRTALLGAAPQPAPRAAMLARGLAKSGS